MESIGPRLVLVLIAAIVAAVSAFVDALPVPPASPRFRLFPAAFAVFAAAFLFP